MNTGKFKKILLKILRGIGWFIFGIMLLLIVVILSLRIPVVQQKITTEAVKYFKSKVDTEASIGRLYIGFPTDVVLEDVYVEDQQGDTLVYLKYLSLNTNLWGLLDNKFEIDDLEVQKLIANIYNTGIDSTFNYQFIIDGFAANAESAPEKDTTASEPFTFAIYSADIKNSRIRYDDLHGGSRLSAGIGDFQVDISEFDLNKSLINIDQVSLKNSEGSFTILKETPSDTTSAHPFDIGGKSLLVENVKFTFEDKLGGMKVLTDLGRISTEIKRLDLTNQVYEANSISIANSFISIDQYSSEKDTVAVVRDTLSAPMKLIASTGQADITNLSFRLYDHNQPTIEGFDPYHMWFQQVNADLGAIVFENGYTAGMVNELSAREKGGMVLQHFQALFKYGKTESYVRNLELVTENSTVSGNVAINYPSVETMTGTPQLVEINATFERSKFDLTDLFYFQPELRSDFSYLTGNASNIVFSGNIDGTLADLTVQQFEVEALGATQVALTGNVKGLPEVNEAQWDINLKNLSTTRNDIKLLAQDTLIPPNIQIPAQITVSGKFKGRFSDFTTKAKVKSSYGGLDADIKMAQKSPELYSYKGMVSLDSFNVGALLGQQEQMGSITMNAAFDGEGFSLEDINTDIKGKVESFVYNSYNYENLNINGHVRSQEFQGDLSMDDPNLDFNFSGLVSLNDSVPQYQFTLDLKRVDLQALNFSDEELQVRAKVVSDIGASSLKDINGTLAIEDFYISRSGQIYRIDTFMLASTTRQDITDITITSSIIDAQFEGNFNLATLPEVLVNHINRYYSFGNVPDVDRLEPQAFDFFIDIKRPHFFSELLITGLEEFRPGPITGSYNSELWELNINIAVPQLVFEGTAIDSLVIDINSNEESLGFDMEVAKVTAGGMGLENLQFRGLVEADHVKVNLMVLDNDDEEKYHLGGIMISGPDYYRFQFTPGEFVLNYDSWEVKPSNRIDFYPSGIWIENMNLISEGQQIHIESAINQQNDSILSTNIQNFDLSFLGRLEETRDYVITGILGGEIDINMQSSGFVSDLKIDKFSYRGDTLGDITIEANTAAGNRYNLNMGLTSNANDLKVTGYYIGDSVPVLHLDADLNRLDLSTVEGFSMGQLRNLEGWLTGDLKVTGTLQDPDIVGGITFRETSFTVDQLQTRFDIVDESIRFTKAGISFDNFVLRDQNGNKASVNGRVLSDDYRLFDLDLRATTNNFTLLNSTANDNELFYGNVQVTSDITIKGTSELPQIQVNVRLNEGSNITYVIPEEEIQLQEREGIVEFFDKDMEDDPFMRGNGQTSISDTVKSALRGINLTAKIDVDRNSSLSVIIDPVTGDQLTVAGDANLTLSIRPSGDMTLTGRYEVYEGAYNMNFYGMVKREFNIRQGSNLIWTGDVLNPRMNITATYAVTATYELPGQTTVGAERAPFIVYLNIKNELLNPEISFDLGLAEEAAGSSAQNFISQVSTSGDVNAQVFYLLIFKSTKSLDSYGTTSAGGNVAEATARSSASRLLSNQLNQLAGRIEGVELSLDLQSYNTGAPNGGTTQLELGLSKELFNERLVVKVAGNVGLEGEEADQQENLSDFAGDIRIEYKLTKDGRFRLVGFRENEFDNLLQGSIIKTGAGVIFVRDYDAFKELFSGDKSNNE